MKKSLCLVLLISGWLLHSCDTPSNSALPPPVKIILDTDIGPDFDDVGAMAVLHCLADSGKAEIVATLACNKDSLVVPTIEVLNTWFGRPEIPVGAPKSSGVSLSSAQHWPDSIVSKFLHPTQSSGKSPDAVDQYRKLLTTQPDHSITLVTIGFLTNLSNLLKSGPDLTSPLNGLELVTRKVKNLVCMAGNFPSGKEYNIYMDSTASKYCFEHWPTPIIFTGLEIGEKIKTGLKLVAGSDHRNPVSEAFRIAMAGSKEDLNGHMSWDQTAVLIAIYGSVPFFTTVNGTIQVNPDGSNGWVENFSGKHSYVKFKMNPDSLSDFIEKRMMHLPMKKK